MAYRNFNYDRDRRDLERAANRSQTRFNQANLVNDLRRRRAMLMKSGAFGGQLPEIMDNQSQADLARVSEQLATLEKSGQPKQAQPTQTRNDGVSAPSRTSLITKPDQATAQTPSADSGFIPGTYSDTMNKRAGGNWADMTPAERRSAIKSVPRSPMANGGSLVAKPEGVYFDGNKMSGAKNAKATSTYQGRSTVGDSGYWGLDKDGAPLKAQGSRNLGQNAIRAMTGVQNASRGVEINPKYLTKGDSNYGYAVDAAPKPAIPAPAAAGTTLMASGAAKQAGDMVAGNTPGGASKISAVPQQVKDFAMDTVKGAPLKESRPAPIVSQASIPETPLPGEGAAAGFFANEQVDEKKKRKAEMASLSRLMAPAF